MPNIKLSTNLVGILLTLLLEGLTLAFGSGLIPPHLIPYVMFALAFIPKGLSVLAHMSNPNGTPVALPYVADAPEISSAAQAAYEAYRAKAAGKSLATGAVIPFWEQLSPAIQSAWKVAAGAARSSPGGTA